MKYRISQFNLRFARAAIGLVIGSLLFGSISHAQTTEPIRHTIIKGDTLWDLASHYLENPWLWPDVWKQNSYIENPDLIYPGDVLVISPNSIRLIRNKHLTTNKLSPQIRSTPAHAITTIDPNIIMPYLTQSIIVEPGVLEKFAYVLRGLDDKIILGRGSRFYATGFGPSTAKNYMVFSKGRAIKDAMTDTAYGIEGVHLGLARMIKQEGDVFELIITEANQDIRPGDFLMPIEQPTELPRYFPRRPDTRVDTRIISIPKGLHEAGRRDVVIISGGKTDGLEEGNVLEVFSYKGAIKDPVTGRKIALPDNKIANLMVFKAYEKVSYALLMETSSAVKIGDRASSP